MGSIDLGEQLEEQINENSSLNEKPNDDQRREALGLSQREESEDYNAKLLTIAENSVYNDCTIPFQQETSKTSIFGARQISSCLSNSSSTTPLTNGENAFTMVNLDQHGSTQGSEPLDDDTEGLGGVQVRYTNKSSVREEMIHSINSLRLNVNNHIIGGSKNVMGKMRKLSIGDLNRHGRQANRNYKFASYVGLISLSLIFLYLIYQNLFNDR